MMYIGCSIAFMEQTSMYKKLNKLFEIITISNIIIKLINNKTYLIVKMVLSIHRYTHVVLQN